MTAADFYNEADTNSNTWNLAVAAANLAIVDGLGTHRARIAVISDSLAELSGQKSGAHLWPHRLGATPGWRFVPASPSWSLAGSGEYGFPGAPGQPAQAVVTNAAQTAASQPTPPLYTPQIILDAAGESVTFDVQDATWIRLLYRYEWGVHVDPQVYWDSDLGSAFVFSGDWLDPNDSDNKILLTWPVFVGERNSLTVQRNGSGNVCLYGALIKCGDSPIDVLNLARSSSTTDDWNTWLWNTTGPDLAFSKLLKGFRPHLVILPSAGNDWARNRNITEPTIAGRLDDLKLAVTTLLGDVAFAIPTNPNIDLTDARLLTFNSWIRSWGATNCDYVLDWEVQLPSAPVGSPPLTDNWFLTDGIHLRPSAHGRVADYAREILLPVLR
jgi:hypothetical protein